MPAPPTASTASAETILAKTTLALAHSQRLIATWLPPPTPSELDRIKTPAELEREEVALFTPVPERLGLGAPVPTEVQDGDGRGGERGDERLRRRLLGREMARIQGRVGAVGIGVEKRGVVQGGALGKGSRAEGGPVGKRQRVEDEGDGDVEEEERGRSSVGKAKRRVVVDVGMDAAGVGDVDVDVDRCRKTARGDQGRLMGGEGRRKGAGSYLDQVLAEKALKKRRKKRRKESVTVDAQ